MRLTKLTLAGFKSFADSAEFTFDEAVTGVVGPNGCGKSNIVDAIKWVLGERSSKSLRGTEMLDVIFAGSAGRKPGGMASVTLTFDNPAIANPVMVVAPSADEAEPVAGGHATVDPLDAEEPSVLDMRLRGKRGLPIDADEVEVERRLYRDGTSQYLINGKKARLRDIRELFLDTGIGADAYSIIEQGKVDAMLLASPQERRTIFEEAAGVAKYKQRRIEAERKLEKAQLNLVQTRDQLESTERRLRIVKGQAVKARRFKELDEQLRAWRTALALDQYDLLARQILTLTGEQLAVDDERVRAAATVTGAETDKQDADIARQETASSLRSADQDRLAAEHSQQQASQRAQMTERAIAEAERRAEQDAARLADLDQRAGETDAAAEVHRAQTAGLSEAVVGADRALSAANESRAAAMRALGEHQAKAADRRAHHNRVDRERAGVVASLEADAKRVEAAREQTDRVASRLAAQVAERERVGVDTAGVEAAAGAAKARAEGLAAEVAAAESTLDTLGTGRREQARRTSDLEQDLARLESRRATLLELTQSRAGYGEAVQLVLASRDAGTGYGGVLGALADLVEASSDDAGILEAALGPDLEALVVESHVSLPSEDERRALPGRVTFLLAKTPHEAAHAGVDLEPFGGRVRAVRSMVRSRGGSAVDGLLDRVLGRTFAVGDAETALLLGAGPLSGARFVTPDATIIEPDGRVIAGPRESGTEGAGVLARRHELATLETQVADLAARVRDEREALAATDAEAAAMNARAVEFRAALAGQQRQLLAEQSRLERLAADEARLLRDIRALEQELAALRERSTRLDADRDALRARADALAVELTQAGRDLVELEAAVKTAQAAVESATERMTAARVDSGKAAEQLAAARREASRLDAARDELSRQRRDAASQIEHASARVEEHRRVLAESAVASAEAAALAVDLRVKVEGLQADLARADAAASDAARRLTDARRGAGEAEKRWASIEMARREAEIKRETLEDRAREDLSLDLAGLHPEYRELLDSGGVVRPDHDRAQGEIEALRGEVRRLGNVNLDSIEEETQLAARNDELIRQVADIDDACGRLAELIAQLNTVSKERFGEVFDKIRGNFGGEQGMFRRLFGGGKAEVRLMPLIKEVDGQKVVTDETDILESGIEIIAKPPGKEPRSISQLSGGEKTLTAVALLMAIFRSKPSCFCVLDEVDAALDEANVNRFNTVIRQFTDLSHFIVITHNKRTMQSADRLYGVTMQERGVSKRVSVNFNQVARDGTIIESSPDTAKAEPASESAMVEPVVVVGEPAAAEEIPKPGYLRRALAKMREQPQATDN
jgi:chromosome segregation protein